MRTQTKLLRPALVWFGGCLVLSARPAENYSVNHRARLHFRDHGVDRTYAVDLAETPAFELLGQGQIDWKDQLPLTGKSELETKQRWAATIREQSSVSMRATNSQVVLLRKIMHIPDGY